MTARVSVCTSCDLRAAQRNVESVTMTALDIMCLTSVNPLRCSASWPVLAEEPIKGRQAVPSENNLRPLDATAFGDGLKLLHVLIRFCRLAATSLAAQRSNSLDLLLLVALSSTWRLFRTRVHFQFVHLAALS